MTLLERRQDADDGEKARGDVSLGNSRPNGWPARFPGDAQNSSHSLYHDVQGCLAGIGPTLSVPCHRTINELFVFRRQCLIAQAVPRKNPGSEILNQDVAFRTKPTQPGNVLLVFQVGNHTAFISIDRSEALAVWFPLAVSGERWPLP